MLSEEELVVTMEHERHRTLNIWRDAVEFARDVYALTRSFPSDEKFGLMSQLRRAAVSVASNIAEGSKRLPAENKNFLRYALGSLAECDTQMLIAEQLGYCIYEKSLKAQIMSLTIGIRAYGKTLSPRP
jgi:four helix bundle protein